jgi:glycyl-tRNA synthetase
MFLLTLSHAYSEEKWNKEDGSEDSRVVLRIPPRLAPIKLAVLPLTKKDGLPDIARDIIRQCRQDFYCFYEEKDSIGKRYRRMDALGTPYCVTVDHQTKEDNTVTIRNRDTMQQERIPIDAIRARVMSYQM